MKAKLNFKSKRTIIIASIIAVLAVGAGIGGYFYAKGNNQAGATNVADGSSQTIAEQPETQTPNTDNNQGTAETTPNANTDNNNGDGTTETTPDGTDGDNAGNAGNAGNANGAAGNNGAVAGNAGGAATGVAGANGGVANADVTEDTDTDATTTTETVIENITVEEPWESHLVRWVPETLNVSNTEVSVNKRNLDVKKTSTTSTGNNAVSAGDEITYTISVTNRDEEELNSLYISDEIPEGTTFVSAENNGNTEKSDEKITRVYWDLWNLGLKAGDSYSISFKVKVNKNAKGTIKNVAIAEGKESEDEKENGPTKNPVLEDAKKTSVIKRNGEEVEAPAKKGDEITYTISVKNSGEVEGTTNIKDADLAEILKDEKAELVGEIKAYENDEEKATISQESLVNGYDATISASSTYKVVFTVKVNKVEGEILNKATIGGKDTETDKVETSDFIVTKEVTNAPEDGKAYKLGEKVTFTVTVKNNGSVTLENIAVEDKLEGAKLAKGESSTIKELAPGKTAEVKYEYTIKESDLERTDLKNVATAKVEDDEKQGETDPIPVDEKHPHLSVTKKVTNEPEDGKAYALGEKVTFTVTVENDGNVTLENVVVEDKLDGATLAEGANAKVGTLAPGAKATVDYEYVIKETDLDNKDLRNIATAKSGDIEGEGKTDPIPVDKKHPSLNVTKKVTNAPADGKAYKLGEKVTFTVVVINNGNVTLENIVVEDKLEGAVLAEGENATIEKLVPKARKEVKYEYVIKETDLDNKDLRNIATAKSGDTEGEGKTDPIPVDGKNPHLDVTKKVTNAPADGKAYKLGEKVTFTVTVENDGNVTLENVVVEDKLDGATLAEGASAEVGTLAPGAKATVDYEYVIKETDLDNKDLRNIATAKSGDTEGEGKTDPIPVDGKNPHLDVTKKVTNAPEDGKAYKLGEKVTFTVTVENDGNVTLENVVVEDKLDGATLAKGANAEVGTLAPGAKATVDYEYVIKETDLDNKDLRNIATAKSGDTEGEGKTDPIPVDGKNPHLDVTKKVTNAPADGKAYKLGEKVTFTVTVENDGNVTLENVVVEDKLDGATLAKGANAEVGTLAPGAKATVDYEYVIQQSDLGKSDFKNVATAKSGDTEGEGKTDPIPVDGKNPHLDVTKKVTNAPEDGKAYKLGEKVTFTVTVENDGNVTLENVVVEDKLDGATLAKGANAEVGTLAPGAKATVDYEYVIKETDLDNKDLRNIATAKSGDTEGEGKTDPIPVDGKNPHLDVTKKVTNVPADGKAYKLGEKVTFTVTVENDGNVTLENVVVEDKLDGATLAKGANAEVGTLAPGAKATVDYEYVIKETDLDNKDLRNIATAKSGDTEGEGKTDPIPVDGKNPHLDVTKKVTNAPEDGKAYKLGEKVTFTVTVENDGNVTLENVVVEDKLDGATLAKGANAEVGTLAPGAKATVDYEYVIKETDLDNKDLRNIATAKSGDTEGEGKTDPIPVDGKNPHLDVTKKVTNAPADGKAYKLGEKVTFTVTVENDGNVTLENVVVEDKLDGATLAKGANAEVGTLAPGAKATVDYEYVIQQSDLGKSDFKNVATAKSGDTEGEGKTDPIPVEKEEPSVDVTKNVVSLNGKEAQAATVKVNDILGYEIVVTNNGNVDLEGITVTDNRNVYGLDKDGNKVTYTKKDGVYVIDSNLNLEVGETKKYTVYYQVIADDIKNSGKTIDNAAENDEDKITGTGNMLENIATATATYTDKDGNETTVTDDGIAKAGITETSKISASKKQDVSKNTKVEPEEVVTYTITVKNEGNTIQKNVKVKDTMTIDGETRADLKVSNITVDRAHKINVAENGDIIIEEIGINETATITAKYTVKEKDTSTSGSRVIKNTIVVDNDDDDKDNSTEFETKEWKADIKVTKSSKLYKKGTTTPAAEGTVAEYGDTIRYEILATNSGKKAGTVDVTDTVPEGTTLNTNGETNLTKTELEKLASKSGLTKTLNVPGEGTANITFEVTVTAKADTNIKNQATVSDGTKPEDKGYDVEKKLTVVKNSTTPPPITNSNVVIVLDISDSMNKYDVKYKGKTKQQRLSVAKSVVKDFIDQVSLPTDGNGSAISVVAFNGDAWDYSSGTGYTRVLNVVKNGNDTIADTPTEAGVLKNNVTGLTAYGGTCISGALTRARQQINAMKQEKPDNNNIVIFVGDGDPDGDIGDISGEAAKLKGVATVYAVGFAQHVSILENTVASSTDKYFTTVDSDLDLSDIFTTIGDEISTPLPPETPYTENGKYILEDIDLSKEIIIKVNGTQVAKGLWNSESIGNRVIKEGNNYVLDTTASEFGADDVIELEYSINS